MIPQDFVQELLNRADIVDIVERYLPLKKAGANYVACCPFHTEKTPSFTVSPSKQFYHCFGCGAHGSAIGFVMEYSGLNFVEAVKEVAASAGMTVPEQSRDLKRVAAPDEPDLAELLVKAARFYKNQLKSSEPAIAYLKKRGLTGEIAAHFGLGYAPPGWQNLAAAFPDYQDAALLKAGLVVENEEGRRYDRFRDRIMFPIHNQRGIIVGFGGRVLDAGEPKYLNSPETPLFEKGSELYGLPQARQALRSANKVIVVEGYMDVVGLAQHGIANAVATLGTATTAAHVRILLRQSDQVVFCFDGDEAGRRAAWRALENSLERLTDGKRINFLFLPQGEDPDSFVRKAGKQAFAALVDEAVPLSEFLLRELGARVDLRTQEGRAKLLRDAQPLLAKIAGPMLSLMLLKSLAELTGVSPAELASLYRIKTSVPAPARPRAPRKNPSIVEKLLEMLLFEPKLAALAPRPLNLKAEAAGALRPEELTGLEALLGFLDTHPHITKLAEITEHFRASEHETLLRRIEPEVFRWEEKNLNREELEQEFCGAWAQLLDQVRRARIDLLHAKLQREEWTAEDKAQYRELQQQRLLATTSDGN